MTEISNPVPMFTEERSPHPPFVKGGQEGFCLCAGIMFQSDTILDTCHMEVSGGGKFLSGHCRARSRESAPSYRVRGTVP